MSSLSPPKTKTYRTRSGLSVTRLQPVIGAEIEGIDLSAPIATEAAADIRDTLLAHGVIFLRNQRLTYKTHLRFAGIFGRVLVEDANSDRPEVLRVETRSGDKQNSADFWHSDGCYMEVPPSVSLLRSIEIPPMGGDTCFASATAAYTDLPEAVRNIIDPLKYTAGGGYHKKVGKLFYSQEEYERRRREFPVVVHPVVRVHPETGARAIYVNDGQTSGIVDLDNEIGGAILAYLVDRLKQPEYQVRWQWEPDTIAVWDNRAVQHYGIPNHVGDRYLERMIVEGTRPLSIADWEAGRR